MTYRDVFSFMQSKQILKYTLSALNHTTSLSTNEQRHSGHESNIHAVNNHTITFSAVYKFSLYMGDPDDLLLYNAKLLTRPYISSVMKEPGSDRSHGF